MNQPDPANLNEPFGDSEQLPPAEAQAQGGGEVVAWRVPVLQSPFGEWLDHGVRDGLVLVMHRGTHGWKAAGQGHALLAHQIYVKNVEPLCATSHEVAVVGLSGGGWRTVWARSDDDVTHPAPPSAPVGVSSTEREWLQYAIDHMRDDNEPEDATCADVLEALLNRVESAPVGVEGLPEKWRREAPRARVDVGEDASLAWREAVYWCAFQLEAALTQQPAAEVYVDFPQVGTAGPLAVVDGKVTLPDTTMNDLIRHARTGYVEQPAAVDEAVIRLTPDEVQSGVDRVRWAELLIRQLPVDHDGRNSWLLNYGTAASLAGQQGGS